MSIQESLEHVPELREYQEIYPDLFEIAMKLEGLESSTSIHAAGTLITNKPVIESMPMIKQDKELASWFAKEVYSMIKDDPRIEVLMENTDLGVGR